MFSDARAADEHITVILEVAAAQRSVGDPRYPGTLPKAIALLEATARVAAAIGRPVWTHELAFPERLIAEVRDLTQVPLRL